ncbi:MAG: DUF3617 domain-containing protein [Sulfuritalea sp.]|jgi:hypothetical protein|nr:DUF3617 domain-containing protein [Sulfuritalea sp.]
MRGLAILLLSAWAAGATAAPKVNLEEGLWRLNIEMEIPGKGPETGPLRRDICLRPDDVARLAVPPNSPCTVSGVEITARRMRWKVACEQGQMRSAGVGIMEFGGRELSSALVITTAEPYAMTIKQSMTGQRIGPCPPGTATGTTPLRRYGQ